ncbi:hypothetical protein ABLE92_24020 [Gordonia sp. VNQ95]|uniref:hypothetical protein n=1 Tax=Gordonia TaxID=2053 RepID=UPI0032B621E2
MAFTHPKSENSNSEARARRRRHPIRLHPVRWCVIAVSCLLLAAIPVTAKAEPVNRTVLAGPLWTVADGPLCGGRVSLLAAPSAPGTAHIQVVGGFFGVSGTSLPCSVGVSVHWRNLNTGAHGVTNGWVSGTMLPSAPTHVLHADVRTGPGLISLRMDPHRPNLPIPSVLLRVP